MSTTKALKRFDTNDETQMGRGSLTMAWYGLVSAMFFVYIGAALAVAYGTANAIIGLILTVMTFGAINRVLSSYALRHRLTVAQFSRSLLGRSGSILATLIFAATAIYYAVFEGSIVAFAFQAQFGGPIALWCAVVVLYSTPLVAGGVRNFLDKINGWLLPLYWGGLIIAVVWAGTAHGFTPNWLTHAAPSLGFADGGPGWLATFAAYMGVWILMMYTMDFAALGKQKDEEFHKKVTFGWLFYTLAFGANALIGIFLTFTLPGVEATETGVAGGLVKLMGIFGLVVVFASQTRINTANYAMGISNLREAGERILHIKLPALLWTALGAAIIFSLMLLPVVHYLLLALAWQGVLVTGWVSIALTQIALDHREGRTAEPGWIPDHSFHAVNVPGVTAWLVSAAAGLVILQSHVAWGASLGAIITAAVGSLLYALLRRATGIRTALRATED